MSLEHQESESEKNTAGASDQVPANQSGNGNQNLSFIAALFQPPQPPPPQNQPSKEPYKWRDDIRFDLEAIGLVALIVYTVFTILQWAQIRWTNRLTREALNGNNYALSQTLDKMQRQVDAENNLYGQTTQQTILMQKQTEALTAATIQNQFLIAWMQPSRAYLLLVMQNRGKTVASKIQGDIQITEFSIGDKVAMKRKFPDWKFTTDEVVPDQEPPTDTGTYVNISSDEMKGTPASMNVLKLTGTFKYFNGFRERIDNLCFYALGDTQFRNKTGKVLQTMGGRVLSCSELPLHIGEMRAQQKGMNSH